METKLTFGEEISVTSAISLRILDLSKTIHDCQTLGQDFRVLSITVDNLKSAFRKITGVDFDRVHPNL